VPARLVTAPETEPVSVAEAKAHLRLDADDDDATVAALIQAARQHVEKTCRRGLVTQTWELVLERFPLRVLDFTRYHLFPGGVVGQPPGLLSHHSHPRDPYGSFELPEGALAKLVDGSGNPLSPVLSVKYIDGAGVEQTLAEGTDYVVDSVDEPGRVLLAYGKSWPATRAQWDAVKVRYTVGWSVEDVPQPIKSAMLLLVSQLYEHRTPEVIGAVISKVQFAVDNLLAGYLLVRV
jgi:hypothetical protein